MYSPGIHLGVAEVEVMLSLEKGPHYHFPYLGDSSQLAEGHHANKLTFVDSGLTKLDKTGTEDGLEKNIRQEKSHRKRGVALEVN